MRWQMWTGFPRRRLAWPPLLALVLCLVVLLGPQAARAADDAANVQTVWRLLDYVAVDYGGAGRRRPRGQTMPNTPRWWSSSPRRMSASPACRPGRRAGPPAPGRETAVGGRGEGIARHGGGSGPRPGRRAAGGLSGAPCPRGRAGSGAGRDPLCRALRRLPRSPPARRRPRRGGARPAADRLHRPRAAPASAASSRSIR